MKTIRQSKVIRTCKGACRVGDIGISTVSCAGIRTLRIACSWPEADIERDMIHVRFRGIAEIAIRKLDVRS